MQRDRIYFFCGIGGSGMLPLALIVKAMGFAVAGSDRSLDQGRTAQKFDFLRAKGISLFPQDGSGVTGARTVLVTSAAVEDTVPDVAAANKLGATRMTRAELLAQLFNHAKGRIGVAGTSGKSTTTGMIGWVLHRTGRQPTIVNGAVMRNFVTPQIPFASALAGSGDLFVCEVDESDGSIAHYNPDIAVVNNVALDHKPLDELRRLFGDYCAKARLAVLNLDNDETRALAARLPPERVRTYSLCGGGAGLAATGICPAPNGIAFDVDDQETGARHRLCLRVPGRHNAANALAALAAVTAVGVPIEAAVQALAGFDGISRRLETVGTQGGVTVIDDFAHNPDKIAATLAALHAFPGRLLIMFQPHGYGPLKLMRDAFIAAFADHLGEEDILALCDPVYFGGTVERAVTSADIVAGVVSRGKRAFTLPDRVHCGEKLLEAARSGDRIVVLGARDDTLSQFAVDLLAGLAI